MRLRQDKEPQNSQTRKYKDGSLSLARCGQCRICGRLEPMTVCFDVPQANSTIRAS